MILCIPLEARVRTIIRASFIVAKRTSETKYSLSGDSFQMSEITSDQVMILPDTVDVAEGQATSSVICAAGREKTSISLSKQASADSRYERPRIQLYRSIRSQIRPGQ